MNPLPQHSQPMVTPGMVNVGMANAGRMMGNTQMPMQQLPAPPGYNMAGANRPPRWPMMPPQVQRQPYIPQKQVNTTQGSALIAQLTQPPSSVAASGVNQFGQSKFKKIYITEFIYLVFSGQQFSHEPQSTATND